MTDRPLIADAAVPPGCGGRRPTARVPLPPTAAGWLAAAALALSVAAVPVDVGESLCGVWGCFPPLPPLAAMHLLWGVVLAAAVWAVRRWRPGHLRPGGWVVLAAAVFTTAVVVGRDVLDWLAWVSPADARFWPRRAAYVLATNSDVPLVQAALAGAVGVYLAGRAERDRLAATGRTFSLRRGRMRKLAAAAAVIVLGVSAWAAGRHEKPAGPATDDKPVPAPEFAGVTDWVNTKPLKLADQKGKVVVVHFWTNGCINCVHNYPHYRAWQEKYKDAKDFLMVGVHTPEFDAEKDVGRIKERMAKNKLTFAVAVDADQKTWQAWGNRYWPCVYLVDKAGNVRDRWEGELGADGYKKVTGRIDDLLAEPGPKGK